MEWTTEPNTSEEQSCFVRVGGADASSPEITFDARFLRAVLECPCDPVVSLKDVLRGIQSVSTWSA